MLKTLRSRRSHSLSPTNSAAVSSRRAQRCTFHLHGMRGGRVRACSVAGFKFFSAARRSPSSASAPLFQLHETSRPAPRTQQSDQSVDVASLQPLALSSVQEPRTATGRVRVAPEPYIGQRWGRRGYRALVTGRSVSWRRGTCSLVNGRGGGRRTVCSMVCSFVVGVGHHLGFSVPRGVFPVL